jgi:hypothetical protein
MSSGLNGYVTWKILMRYNVAPIPLMVGNIHSEIFRFQLTAAGAA